MYLLRNKGALTLILILICFFSKGQTTTQQLNPQQVEDRLTTVYGADFLYQNPELIHVFGNLNNNYIEYVETPLSSNEKYTLLSSVQLKTKNNASIQGANFSNFDLNEFNPFVYDIEFFSNKTQAFRVDNTNYVMIVKPIITN